MKDEECLQCDCIRGGLSLSVLEINTFSFASLYIITSRASLHVSSSSRLHQIKCCNMSPTLDVFLCLLVTLQPYISSFDHLE
jgi:hypothetical protein